MISAMSPPPRETRTAPGTFSRTAVGYGSQEAMASTLPFWSTANRFPGGTLRKVTCSRAIPAFLRTCVVYSSPEPPTAKPTFLPLRCTTWVMPAPGRLTIAMFPSEVDPVRSPMAPTTPLAARPCSAATGKFENADPMTWTSPASIALDICTPVASTFVLTSSPCFRKNPFSTATKETTWFMFDPMATPSGASSCEAAPACSVPGPRSTIRQIQTPALARILPPSLAPAPSRSLRDRLQVTEELRVRLHHGLDEPRLHPFLPRYRGPQLLLVHENLHVLVPGGDGGGRDPGVEAHVPDGLFGHGDIQARDPPRGDLRSLVRVLPRVLLRLGHPEHVAGDQVRALLDEVVGHGHVDVIADVPAAPGHQHRIRDLGLDLRPERLPDGDGLHAPPSQGDNQVPRGDVEDVHLVPGETLLRQHGCQILVRRPANRRAYLAPSQVVDPGEIGR